MSNEQPSRPKRSGSNASPMGSTLAIVIAIAAVVIGFLILNKIRGSDSKAGPATTTTTTLDPSLIVPPPAVTAAGPPTTVFTTDGATVLVANSSKLNKVAAKLSTALAGKNFKMETPTTGSDKLATTLIQYKEGDTAAQAVALSVAATMGVDPATITTIPTPVKLKDTGTLGAATVLVLLGDDKAGKTLDQMTGAAKTTTGNSSPAPVTATT
jgi:LytR cell envelope-related transcriptional attenuator